MFSDRPSGASPHHYAYTSLHSACSQRTLDYNTPKPEKRWSTDWGIERPDKA